MAERLGRALWPGARGMISCTYTVSHGISPGIATLTVPDQDVRKIAAAGTLVITDGVGTIKIPRCKVIDIKFAGGAGTPRTVVLVIADRRWMWRFGGISGNWNQIDPHPASSSFPPNEFVASDGPYAPGTYRTAEKLLADCLAELNETNPIIEPAPVFPVPMSWDNEPPAAAMQSLCDAIGYRIVYRPALDQVAIVPEGVGLQLPDLPSMISGSAGIDPPERPNAFQLVGGDTIWNDYLALEAVTLEEDGKIVYIDDASYTPAGGWGRCADFSFKAVADQFGPAACALAQKHVWRTFYVALRYQKAINDFGIEVPGYGFVTDRKQIVLGTEIYGVTKDERGQFKSSPPHVIGSVYYPRAFNRPLGAGAGLDALGNTTLGEDRIPVGIAIDSERGLVTFNRHLYRNTAPIGGAIPAAGPVREPNLWLRTSFRIRSINGRVFSRFQAGGERPIQGDPLCPPEVIRRPELQAVIDVRRILTTLEVLKVNDNLGDLRAAADYYLNAADARYQLSGSSERTYAGILPISPDGAIQQVTWTVGGGGPATTQASRNTEHSAHIAPFPERRRREVVQHRLLREPPPPVPPPPSPGGGR